MNKRLIAGMFGVSSLAFFTHAAHAAVETEFGAEYQFKLLNTDDGLQDDNKDVKETDYEMVAAKLALRGKLSDTISFNALYNLGKSDLERFWLTNKVNDNLEVAIGKQKIKTYGWHAKLSSSSTYVTRSFMVRSVNPFKDALAVDLSYKVAGQALSLSFIKDFYDTAATCAKDGTGCTSWNGSDVQKQPAIAFEWVGDFGAIQPIVNFASYDRAHSYNGAVGLRFKNEVIDTYVDYTLDVRNAKGQNAAGTKFEDHESKHSGIDLYGEVFTGDFTPYYLLSTYDNDEYVASGASKVEVNKAGTITDNEQLISVGTFYEGWGKFYRPYVGVAVTAGKYAKVSAPTEKETRTKTDIQLGLTGKF